MGVDQIIGVQDDDHDEEKSGKNWVILDISWELYEHGNGQVEKKY